MQPMTTLTRPTTDKVKEALFSILNSQFLNHNQPWHDLRVVDFFAGSGSLVFEALSRGASYGLAIDSGSEALKAIAHNRLKLKLTATMDIQKIDVTNLSNFVTKPAALRSHQRQPMSRLPFTDDPKSRQFSLIFLDPPYNFQGLDTLVEKVITTGWCSPRAWIVFELSVQAIIPHHSQLEHLITRDYGRIRIVICRLK